MPAVTQRTDEAVPGSQKQPKSRQKGGMMGKKENRRLFNDNGNDGGADEVTNRKWRAWVLYGGPAALTWESSSSHTPSSTVMRSGTV